jgi:hypothetical protein
MSGNAYIQRIRDSFSPRIYKLPQGALKLDCNYMPVVLFVGPEEEAGMMVQSITSIGV